MQNIAYGFYEQVINKILNDILKELDHSLVEINKEKIDSAESSKILADYFARVLEQALNCFSDTEKALIDRVDLCNKMIKYLAKVLKEGTFTSLSKDPTFSKWILDFLIHHDAELLLAILDKKKTQSTRSDRNIVPVTSLASSSLFTGAKYEPSMESEMKKEMLSCDRIDFLVSFIKWSGLRLLKPELEKFTSYGGELRVITTSYLGATDYKAVEELSKLPNTKIKISYDTKHTRLHAKTFVFWRNTGFSTAYIGSSNISHAAMTSGLEWNIKIAQHDSPDIFEKIEASFDAYWNNAEFISFDPRDDGARLKNALETEKKQDNTQQGFSFLFDVKPYYFQQEILDKLHAEREVHNSYKNLVVAATGERVIIVTGCINALVSRISGTFIKNNSCIA